MMTERQKLIGVCLQAAVEDPEASYAAADLLIEEGLQDIANIILPPSNRVRLCILRWLNVAPAYVQQLDAYIPGWVLRRMGHEPILWRTGAVYANISNRNWTLLRIIRQALNSGLQGKEVYDHMICLWERAVFRNHFRRDQD